MKTTDKNRKGISLIESLLALSLFLLIVLSSIEFFGMTRKMFFKLRNAQMDRESALAALDKIKGDVLQAGRGLLTPLKLGLVSGIESNDGALILTSGVKNGTLSADAHVGQTAIGLNDAEDFNQGKYLCLVDSDKGEIQAVGSADGDILSLTAPLVYSYKKEESNVILLQKITCSLDVEKSTLRRKVNAGTPQPLLEGVQSFVSGYDGLLHLVNVGLRLQSDSDKVHEFTAFLKNMALAKEE